MSEGQHGSVTEHNVVTSQHIEGWQAVCGGCAWTYESTSPSITRRAAEQHDGATRSMTDQTPIPPRFQPHYCRMCGEFFDLDKRVNDSSSHARVWQHMYATHGETRDTSYVSCSRNCLERAQHEELSTGQRLYGAGLPPPDEAQRIARRTIFMRMYEEDDFEIG